MANVEWLDPIQENSWRKLVASHPDATVFHTPAWIQALRETYNYRTLVLGTTSAAGTLEAGVLFCHVQSRLTGSRLVSLPFSDHCQPLLGSVGAENLLSHIVSSSRGLGIDHIQLRPRLKPDGLPAEFVPSERFAFHEIDLSPPLESIFQSLHKSSTQRRIRHAQQAGLETGVGRDPHLLDAFYGLLLQTRRRQGLPPQPRAWFVNLSRFLGDMLEVHVAWKDEIPIASILTLRFRDQLIYKYGCSDRLYNHLGATPLLFWRAIERAKDHGLVLFDLGRSDLDNPGLIRFKSNWTSRVSELTYYRWPAAPAANDSAWSQLARRHLIPRLPTRLLEWSGRLLYRHFG